MDLTSYFTEKQKAWDTHITGLLTAYIGASFLSLFPVTVDELSSPS